MPNEEWGFPSTKKSHKREYKEVAIMLRRNIQEQKANLERQKAVLQENQMNIDNIDQMLEQLTTLEGYLNKEVDKKSFRDRFEQAEEQFETLQKELAELEEKLPQFSQAEEKEDEVKLKNLKKQHERLQKILEELRSDKYAGKIDMELMNTPVYLREIVADSLYDFDMLERLDKDPRTQQPFNVAHIMPAREVKGEIDGLLLEFARIQESLVKQIQELNVALPAEQLEKESEAVVQKPEAILAECASKDKEERERRKREEDKEESEGRREERQEDRVARAVFPRAKEAEYSPLTALQMAQGNLLMHLMGKQQELMREFFNYSVELQLLRNDFQCAQAGTISWERFLHNFFGVNNTIFNAASGIARNDNLIASFKSQFDECSLRITMEKNANNLAAENGEISRFIDREYMMLIRVMYNSAFESGVEDQPLVQQAPLPGEEGEEKEQEGRQERQGAPGAERPAQNRVFEIGRNKGKEKEKPRDLSEITLDDFKGDLRLQLLQSQIELMREICKSIEKISGNDSCLDSTRRILELTQSALSKLKAEDLSDKKKHKQFYDQCELHGKKLFQCLGNILIVASNKYTKESMEELGALHSACEQEYGRIFSSTSIDKQEFAELVALADPYDRAYSYRDLFQKIMRFHQQFINQLEAVLKKARIMPKKAVVARSHNTYVSVIEKANLVVKVAVVGEDGVGKTSVILRRSEDIFSDNIAPGYHLNMQNVCAQKVFGSIVQFKICELHMRNLGQRSYQGAHAIIIVLDAPNPASYSSKSLQGWIEEIERYATPGTPVIFFFNKTDLVEIPPDNLREITQLTSGLSEAGRYPCQFLIGSARDDENIEELFTQVGKMVLAKQKLAKDLSAAGPSAPQTSGLLATLGSWGMWAIGSATPAAAESKPKPGPSQGK